MFFIPYGTREASRKIRFPYITILFVLANIAAFAYQFSILGTSGEAGLNDFIMRFATIPADVTDGSPIEIGLLTALFLHGGLVHILGNMIYLLPFGDNVEDRLGHARYFLFYLLCGFAATIIYTLFNADSTVPLIGASGAIAGVLGGYLALHPKGWVKGVFVIVFIPLLVTLPAFLFIGYWFVMQLFGSAASLGADAISTGTTIAFLAHVGGFIAGLLLAPLMQLKRQQRNHIEASYPED